MKKALGEMKDEEIVSLMQNQIKEVKEGGDDKATPSDAEAKDAEMK
jgi:hypothetical protein